MNEESQQKYSGENSREDPIKGEDAVVRGDGDSDNDQLQGITVEVQDKQKTSKAPTHSVDMTHDSSTSKHHHDRSQFAIIDKDKNTDKNPYREGTNTVPIFVRRIDSADILPRPFRTTTQLILVSFLSVLCNVCFGAFAARKAMKTKIQRNKGLYTVAQRNAKKACYFIVAAVAIGLLTIIIVLLTNLL